jgi:hypothetical protein
MCEKIKETFENSMDCIGRNYEYVKSILIFITILFVWIIFADRLMELFDKFMLPILSIKEFQDANIICIVIFFLMILVCIYGICKIIRHRYHISLLGLLLLSLLVVIYSQYRDFGFGWGKYISIPQVISIFGYTDILFILLSISVVLLWLFQFFPNKIRIENNPVFISDIPINKIDDDILDYSDSAKELAKELESIELSNAFSIGLLAPWGAGKTSFMNLLESFLDKNKFVIAKFNPRHSLSSNNIQEDFFKCLISELKKYDSTFTSSYTEYLKAINILAENKIISTFLGFHKLWNKESEKNKINKAIKKTGKRIIVFIDDFDRLLADDIIEIFKLLDGNASFSNMIFITAYNKVLTNKIIADNYNNEGAFFSEKFFTLEIPIPIRDYEKTYIFLKGTLLSKNIIDEKQAQIIDNYFHNGILKKYISNLRDAKRFINLLIWQYKKILNDVEFEDYFLLSLIQNKYFDEYSILFNDTEQYISQDFMKIPGRYYLNKPETFTIVPNSKDILEQLFSDTTTTSITSIKKVDVFGSYFFNKVYNGIPMLLLKSILTKNNIGEVKLIIDNWVLNNKLNYLLTYLDSKIILELENKEQFERYLDILMYVNCKNYSTDVPSFKIYALLYKENQKEICEKYDFTEDNFKTMLSIKLKGSYPEYPDNITQSIIIGLIDNQFKGEIILNKIEALEIAKSAFNDYISTERPVNQKLINMLYSCIIDIEKDTRLVTLDENTCSLMKNAIQKSPAGYFEKFVRLGGWTSNPEYNTIACEPFWEQIFGNDEAISRFIKTHQSKIPNVRLINNFWKLYENNSYKPIQFEHQGNVQDKITNNLEAEINDLNTLLDIEHQFEELEIKRLATPRKKDDEVYLKRYNGLLNQIDKIHLYITKRGDIIRKINVVIQSMK